MSDTPKTDAKAFVLHPIVDGAGTQQWVVDREFARAQERRIAELETRIQEELTTKTALLNECMHYRRELRDLAAAAQVALTVKKP